MGSVKDSAFLILFEVFVVYNKYFKFEYSHKKIWQWFYIFLTVLFSTSIVFSGILILWAYDFIRDAFLLPIFLILLILGFIASIVYYEKTDKGVYLFDNFMKINFGAYDFAIHLVSIKISYDKVLSIQLDDHIKSGAEKGATVSGGKYNDAYVKLEFKKKLLGRDVYFLPVENKEQFIKEIEEKMKGVQDFS